MHPSLKKWPSAYRYMYLPNPKKPQCKEMPLRQHSKLPRIIITNRLDVGGLCLDNRIEKNSQVFYAGSTPDFVVLHLERSMSYLPVLFLCSARS